MSRRDTGRAHAVRAVLAAGLLVALVALVFPAALSASAADDPTTDPTATTSTTASTTATATATETDTGPLVVDDAVFAWGLNDESNNKAFAPGTYNFLSAGEVPDPGQGGVTMEPAGRWSTTGAVAWRATAGETTIEKLQPGGGYATATFGGLSTGVDGTKLTSTSGPFSGHRVTIAGGTGTVDPSAGTARITWDGAFSVVYYSGYTFFSVSDPVLVVTPTSAQVRATLSGYAADRTDPTKWGAVAPQQVVLADLPRADVDLTAEGGFTVAPAYTGVAYTGPSGDQVGSPATRGAFPASFLAYMDKVGSAAFFYSSGGSADPHKIPKAMTFSYDASAQIEPEPTDDPTSGVTDPPVPTTTVNPEPPAPTTTVTSVVTQPAAPPLVVPTQPAPPVVPPVGAEAVAAAALPQPQAVPTAYADLATVSAATGSAGGSPAWPWWLGALLLVAATAVALPLHLPPNRTHPRSTPSKGTE